MEKFEQNTAKVWYITTTHLLGSFPWADSILSLSKVLVNVGLLC